jgi:dTDP-4-amino-4,6-dideoxygalactose transaminase
MKPKIWLSPPHMSGNEVTYIHDAFVTNWISPIGPNVDGFESDISDYLGVKAAAALSSGTAAIHLALLLLGVGEGDYVLCSSFTFSASVNPVCYLKAIPILIDCEMETWNMDPELLREGIVDTLKKTGKKPKAIILVHLYGMPARIAEIFRIAEEFEIPVIEDAAEALGSSYHNRPVGTFGEFGVLSFNGNKIITTSGGGALVSNRPELIARARFLATQARDDAPHYQHSEVGYNYRMSNIVAGIGRGQMMVLSERLRQRRLNNKIYKDLLSDIKGLSFQNELPGLLSNFWLTTVIIQPELADGITREDVRLALEEENIEARPLWKPMHMQPVFSAVPRYENGTSESLFTYGLCLPSGSSLEPGDLLRVVNIVRKSMHYQEVDSEHLSSSAPDRINIPFSPPRMDDKIVHEVGRTLLSGWITTGPKTGEFEQKITKFCGNKVTVCVSSATAGLELVLKWFGVGSGDEVILPSYTYCATGNVVLRCGAVPVLVDVNRECLIDVEEIRKHITERTKVIIPVDFGGLPCDYDEIVSLVKEPGIRGLFRASGTQQEKLGRILILADAAHSFGAVYKGKKSGVLADITVFSFHAVKNLTTAEGGAIALHLRPPFDNKELYQYLRTYSLHGQTKDALLKSHDGGWKYDVIIPGLKANMTDVLATIGLVELERYESETLIKLRHVFGLYDELLGKYSWAELPVYRTKTKTSSYHIYHLRIKGVSENGRDSIIQECHRKGVMVNVHFIPLSMFTAYKSAGYSIDETPEAYNLYAREISLPVFYDISDEQISYVSVTVAEAVEKYSNVR